MKQIMSEKDNFDSKKSTREKGAEAEKAACEFLIGLGYTIVKQNFHWGTIGEIDIIAKDKDILVFIEVKARTSDSWGHPIDSITPKKQSQIRKVAEGYYYVNKLVDVESRYDVITIDYSKEIPEIEHYINAFY